MRLTDPLRQIEFFPDGNAFVTASMDGHLRVWRTGIGKP